MRDFLYDIPSALIALALLVSMAVAIEIGYRLGSKSDVVDRDSTKSHVNTILGALLGILALLLGFNFSLALQRYDGRFTAVVEEANAIGTAYLRAQLLPESVRADVQTELKNYLDVRVDAATINLVDTQARAAKLAETNEHIEILWSLARKAVSEEANPVTTGLFVQALNTMIDAFGTRTAALDRHVPQLVLFLLYTTFLMAGAILGYASGVAGHRVSFVAYIMVGLIVVIVFIIIDLDRPRRGLIQVSQKSLTDLQAAIAADFPQPPPPPDGAGALPPTGMQSR